MSAKRKGGLVYSSEHGVMCPACGKPTANCACGGDAVKPPRGGAVGPRRGGAVRVGRETKGRKGKGVTVITGLALTAAELAALAGELKRRCGSGGTVRDGAIEIQGDHRDTLVAELARRGFEAKRSGG